jgi:hypothetical protein
MSTFLVFLLVATAFTGLAWVGWHSRDEEFAEDDRPLFVGIVLALLAVAILTGFLLRALFGSPESLPARLAHAVTMVGAARLSLPLVRTALKALIGR